MTNYSACVACDNQVCLIIMACLQPLTHPTHHQGPYVAYIGRATAPLCPFYCKSGADIVNRTACLPCTNGTYSPTPGATACFNCASGTWAQAAQTVCASCSQLLITAGVGGGSGVLDYVGKAGWTVKTVVCVP